MFAFRRKRIRSAAAFMATVLSHSALAVMNCNGPAIDARLPPYSGLSAVANQNIGAFDEDVLRGNVMTAVIGAYRGLHGPTSMDPGKTFKMIYKDASKECGVVVNRVGSLGAIPVPDTQRPAPGNGPIDVENTRIYLQQFNRINQLHGSYQVCYDYYSDGVLTATQCTVQTW